MAQKSSRFPLSFVLSILLHSCFRTSWSQSISTNTPVPPLQWINLTPYLSGPAAPPLMDASIGYDENSRSLIIFGGESQGGFPQSQTYLLELDTLTWATPVPPDGLTKQPPARSAAVGGSDFAASYRRGHIVIGGKDANGNGLSDVWEFDYINHFWSEVNLSPGGPSARGGASGGVDPRITFTEDPRLSYPNNTFYVAGGSDGTTLYPLSEVWMLNVTGTLSSNLPTNVDASWQSVTIDSSLTPKVNQAGTVIGQEIVSVGGCNITSVSNDSCAQPDSYVINVPISNVNAPNPCPAPRLGAAVAPNMNGFSKSFASQTLVLLGIFNTSLWNDDGGLEKGEVAILDINAGAWARILPSGDPGSTGTPAFPSPRQGAAALSYTSQLVGSNRAAASDTIIFGGRDASGNYMSDLWLLRAYNGSISQSNQQWSGFGSGTLQSGADASGEGVTIQYMTRCAVALDPSYSSYPIPSSVQSGSPTSSPTSGSGSTQLYDTSVPHKLLAPLSIALLMIAVLSYRLCLPSSGSSAVTRHIAPVYGSVLVTVIAYGLGIGGFVNAFASIKPVTSLTKRSTSLSNLTTTHGRAGLALFVCMYGLVPVLGLCWAGWSFRRFPRRVTQAESGVRSDPQDAAEKPNTPGGVDSGSLTDAERSTPGSPRRRSHSFGGQSLLHVYKGRAARKSAESGVDSVSTAGPQRGFEVVNRPSRPRRSSGNSLAAFANDIHYHRVPVVGARSLADLSWLDRRRSLNMVGELDYALGQMGGTAVSTPRTAGMLSTQGLMTASVPLDATLKLDVPTSFEIVLRVLFHASLAGLCILTLVALWYHASVAAFAVFLAWTIIFYAAIFILAWHGKPRQSLLTILFSRMRGHTSPVPSATPSHPPSTAGHDQYPFPTESRGPYIHHQPQYWAAGHDDLTSVSHGRRSTDTNDPGDEEDEDTRQRRMEEEMDRRDVSIVTVPKRKLWVANPS